MACNSLLQPVSKEEARQVIPRRTAELHDKFQRCKQRDRIYWKGSHYDRMRRWIEELVSNAPANESTETFLII